MSDRGTNQRLEAIEISLERVKVSAHQTQAALADLARCIEALACREDESQKVEITVRIVIERPEPRVYPMPVGGTITVTG